MPGVAEYLCIPSYLAMKPLDNLDYSLCLRENEVGEY